MLIWLEEGTRAQMAQMTGKTKSTIYMCSTAMQAAERENEPCISWHQTGKSDKPV